MTVRYVLILSLGVALGFMLLVIAFAIAFVLGQYWAPLWEWSQVPPSLSFSSDSSQPAIASLQTATPFQPGNLTRIEFTPVATRTPAPTASATLTSTASPTPTITTTLTATSTHRPTKTRRPTRTPTNTPPSIPAEARIEGLVGYPQLSTLDCEARSAVDLAAYFGLMIDEYDFLAKLPISDDPDEGFVGQYWGAQGHLPPNSYGVHAGPVAALLRAYGLNAYDAKDLSFEVLQAEIAAGRPVIVWVIYNIAPGTPIEYTASSGHTTTVARYEHTAILIGYDPDTVTLVDGAQVYQRPIKQFLDSWAVLRNMAVLVGEPALLK